VFEDDRPGMRGWLYNGREVPLETSSTSRCSPARAASVGLSPIAAYAQTLGVGLQAQTYASDWFAAGGFPPGTFKNSEKSVTQDEAEIIKARVVPRSAPTRRCLRRGLGLQRDHGASRGGAVRGDDEDDHEPDRGVYGIPPEMIGGESGSSMTYANVEQQQINFVMFTLRPWLVRLETRVLGAAAGPAVREVQLRRADPRRPEDPLGSQPDPREHRVRQASTRSVPKRTSRPCRTAGTEVRTGGPRVAPALPSNQNNPGDVTPMRRVQ
jgi:hypothetical protein